MRLGLGVVTAALVFAGLFVFRVYCVPGEKELALRKCEFEALTNGGFKSGWQTVGEEFPRLQCIHSDMMGAVGYRGNMLANCCGVVDAEHNPWCYAPTSLIDGAAWRVYAIMNGGSIGGLFYQSYFDE